MLFEPYTNPPPGPKPEFTDAAILAFDRQRAYENAAISSTQQEEWECRIAFWNYDAHQLNTQQVADALGRTGRQVSKSLKRSRRKLTEAAREIYKQCS